jgi:hypothetical protein
MIYVNLSKQINKAHLSFTVKRNDPSHVLDFEGATILLIKVTGLDE